MLGEWFESSLDCLSFKVRKFIVSFGISFHNDGDFYTVCQELIDF